VLLAEAGALNAPLYLAGQDWQGRSEHGRMVYEDTDQLLDLPLPNLIGQHQIINAAAAIATLSTVGLLPAEDIVAKGITSAFWPARLQKLEAKDFDLKSSTQLEIYLDGAHNEGAAKVLSSALADMNEAHPKPLTLICGMLSTKDAAAFFEEFKGLAARIYTVPIAGEPAAVPSLNLAACARAHGFVADPMADVPTALKAISLEEGTQRVMICGSLYLAGQVLKMIKAL
jgi:dihydrofolate synthase/folylpolyglutamate synthase